MGGWQLGVLVRLSANRVGLSKARRGSGRISGSVQRTSAGTILCNDPANVKNDMLIGITLKAYREKLMACFFIFMEGGGTLNVHMGLYPWQCHGPAD